MSFADEPLRCDGRVVLITGAARGIGAATASLLGRFGATLALCDRVPESGSVFSELADAEGTAVLARVLDVRDPPAVDEFVADVIDRFGKIDILVNNAGGSFAAEFLEVTDKGEAMLIAENFTQVAHLVRRTVPAMAPGSSIVNVTSIEAHQGAPGFAVYAAMKAAVDNLTRTLALELAPRGIRVNAVAPDALPSRGERMARDQLLDTSVGFEPALVPPLGHFGTPDDAAGAVLYLSSDLARFVTGTTLHVDGGNHAAGGWRRTGRSPN
ncbi:MAG TPA: SDR family oxidoreductase [Acidimicrobiales bacterium]|jgi:NAD(P)-dependent dehydrogenase (short-subunit alcohol dehydrogenase family)|nr:SDR family oxidoreductase [Acidimicrobiales bacterium]